jgi:glycosyltransferase involved in cell wall biosynthesis/GT2 family glycosyltransferase
MATRDGAATLPLVLEAYCHLLPPPGGWQLLVADNGSMDGTATVLASYAARLPLRYLHAPAPGKNAALNAVLEVALAEPGNDQSLFLFTDDDAIPASDWLQQWQACGLAHPDYSVFGGAIEPDWAAPLSPQLKALVPLGLTYGLTSPVLEEGPVFPGLVWGANMAVRRAAFAAGHRFDTAVGPNGADYAMGSETELTRRLSLAGYHSWFCPAARVAHHIRPQQTSLGYVLQKAWRFGRGMYRQQQPGRFAEQFGVPRWMLRQYLQELCGLAWAILAGGERRKFRRRWELAYLRGYFHEAWRGRPLVRKTVLVTSYSGELGGMEMRMAQEIRYLQSAGYAGMLALRHFPELAAWTQRLTAEQINVTEFSPPPFFEGDWRLRRLRCWRARGYAAMRLRAFKADLIHVALCWTNYGASMLWLARYCKLPAVVSVHNAFPMVQFSAWHDGLLRAAFQGVRGIYAVSDSALAHFNAIYRPYILASTRQAVIPNGVDVERFQPSAAKRSATRTRLGLPRDALVIGVVARLSQQKQPETSIALFAALRQRFPGLYLVMAGSGPLEPVLREQVKGLRLRGAVIFAGFVEAVDELMPALDLHVLMSRNEGFGIATVEAMACGVPAVATDVPGSADILRDCPAGMLVPAGDLDAAVRLVGDLLADPARRAAMGNHGRAEAVQRYSNAVVAGQVLDFYRGLL